MWLNDINKIDIWSSVYVNVCKSENSIRKIGYLGSENCETQSNFAGRSCVERS